MIEVMDSDNEQGYKPRPDFQVEAKEPLIDLSSTDNTELWLIQWPKSKDKELPGLDGQELSLKLHHDGQLGSFEDSSGKAYDVVSFAAQESNATVFLSSASESKIVGKISRLVSLVHYPEPNEIQNLNSNSLRQSYQNSRGISLTNSSRQFSTPSSILRKSQSTSRHQRSSLSELGEPSETPKKDMFVNLLGLWSIVLKIQDEVTVSLPIQGCQIVLIKVSQRRELKLRRTKVPYLHDKFIFFQRQTLRNGTKQPTGKGEWVVHDQPGVYITLSSLPGGGNELKRVRFSRKHFTEEQAEKWWAENGTKVCERHNILTS